MTTEISSDSLRDALRENAVLCQALQRLSESVLPDWYLGAGCVAQTVWNLLAGEDPNRGIRDYDIVYFGQDLSEHAEAETAAHIQATLADLHIRADVKNQARVHQWYPRRFGYGILPYESSADAISTWPTTATAVGVRVLHNEWSFCAPYGIGDLFRCVVRPNRVQITPSIYESRIQRWSLLWPFLTFLDWEDGIGQEASRWDTGQTE